VAAQLQQPDLRLVGGEHREHVRGRRGASVEYPRGRVEGLDERGSLLAGSAQLAGRIDHERLPAAGRQQLALGHVEQLAARRWGREHGVVAGVPGLRAVPGQVGCRPGHHAQGAARDEHHPGRPVGVVQRGEQRLHCRRTRPVGQPPERGPPGSRVVARALRRQVLREGPVRLDPQPRCVHRGDLPVGIDEQDVTVGVGVAGHEVGEHVAAQCTQRPAEGPR
jgi:hypothetical protein